jgi:hypothetical protein
MHFIPELLSYFSHQTSLIYKRLNPQHKSLNCGKFVYKDNYWWKQ